MKKNASNSHLPALTGIICQTVNVFIMVSRNYDHPHKYTIMVAFDPRSVASVLFPNFLAKRDLLYSHLFSNFENFHPLQLFCIRFSTTNFFFLGRYSGCEKIGVDG